MQTVDMREVIIPFWDPFSSILAIAVSGEKLQPDCNAVSLELIEPNGGLSLIGEIQIGLSNGIPESRTLNALPFFKIPNSLSFRIWVRIFKDDQVLASQEMHFQSQPSNEDCNITCALAWDTINATEPQLVTKDQLETISFDNPTESMRLLQCKTSASGSFCEAIELVLVKYSAAHRVTTECYEDEELDPIGADHQVRLSETVEMVFEPAADWDDGREFSGQTCCGVRLGDASEQAESIIQYPLVPENNGQQFRVRFQPPPPHRSHIFACMVDGSRLSFQEPHGRVYNGPVVAFQFFGSKCIFDVEVSKTIEREQRSQLGQPQATHTPVKIIGDREFGPAGWHALEELYIAFNDVDGSDDVNGVDDVEDLQSDGEKKLADFLETLRAIGVNPADPSTAVDYANLVHALQWKKIYESRSILIDRHAQGKPPPKTYREVAVAVLAAGHGLTEIQLETWAHINKKTDFDLWRAARTGQQTVIVVPSVSTN